MLLLDAASGFDGPVMEGSQLLRAKVEEIAERLRHEPYRLFLNDCLVKSIRFTRECKRVGINAKIVLCLGSVSARMPLLSRRLTVLTLHVWGEVEGERIEVSRPLGAHGILDVIPKDIKPILRVRL